MPSSLLQKTLDTLGRDIVSGRLPAGHVVPTQRLETEFGVSRSVIREAVRVLQTIGLVSTVKRIGVSVLSEESWNYFDPRVMEWRWASERFAAQLRSLTELRGAIEPAAAELAARHAPDRFGHRLLALAAEMRVVVRAGDHERFIDVDVTFHQAVLAASGNEMFAQLQSAIGNTVSGRSDAGLLPELPDEDSLQLHVDLADAIQGHHPEKARRTAARLVEAIAQQTSGSWSDQPRSFGSNG